MVWISLAHRLFAAKTPFIGYWISLDFLGFSRPNLSLINGLHGKSRPKVLLGPFVPWLRRRRGGGSQSWRAEKRGRSSGKLTLISGFQQ